jgi:hypothetical protein
MLRRQSAAEASVVMAALLVLGGAHADDVTECAPRSALPLPGAVDVPTNLPAIVAFPSVAHYFYSPVKPVLQPDGVTCEEANLRVRVPLSLQARFLDWVPQSDRRPSPIQLGPCISGQFAIVGALPAAGLRPSTRYRVTVRRWGRDGRVSNGGLLNDSWTFTTAAGM